MRCRNHGLKIILRGHKQYCPYSSCTCDKCRFTAEQQRQMRLQNAIRRAEAADRVPGVGRRHRTAPTMVPSQTPQQAAQQQIVVTVQNSQNGTTAGKNSLHSIIIAFVASSYYHHHHHHNSRKKALSNQFCFLCTYLCLYTLFFHFIFFASFFIQSLANKKTYENENNNNLYR